MTVDVEDTTEDHDVRPKARTVLIVLGAASLGLVAAGIAGWALRVPIASSVIKGQLAGQGVESTFRIIRLDWGGVDVADLRLGPSAAPDLTIARAEIRFAWAGVAPGISLIRLTEPNLHARLDDKGLDLGSLNAFLKPGPPSRVRPQIPAGLTIEITRGTARLDTPFGTLPIALESRGALRRDLLATATLPQTALVHGENTLDAQAILTITGDAQGIEAVLEGGGGAKLGDLSADAIRFRARAQAPNGLASAQITYTADAGALALGATQIIAPNLAGAAEASMGETSLAPTQWRATAEAAAARITGPDIETAALTASAELAGDSARARGRLTASTGDAPARLMGFRGPLAASADLDLNFGEQLALTAAGAVQSPHLALTAGGRDAFRGFWPKLGGTPLDPLLTSSGDGFERGLVDAALNLPFRFTLHGEATVLAITGPATLTARSGARMTLTQARPDTPAFAIDFSNGAFGGAALLALAGGGLPTAEATLEQLSGGGSAPLLMRAALSFPDWRSGDARLVAPELSATLSQTGANGELRLTGPASLTGPAGGVTVRDLQLPLDLIFAWGEAGFRVSTADSACVALSHGGLGAPGMDFGAAQARLCPLDGALYAADARDKLSGGFSVDNLTLAGHMQDHADQPARLSVGQITGRFSGVSSASVLDIVADAPKLTIDFAPDRQLDFTATRLVARTESSAAAWRAFGDLENGALTDTAIPADITDIAASFTAIPAGDDVQVDILEGRARMTDRPPPGSPTTRRAAFQPLILRNIQGRLNEGRIAADGALLLEEGERQLGVFDAAHDLETAAGQAQVRIRDLAFAPNFQPPALSELARGTVENVTGGLEGDVNLHWAPDVLTADGRVKATNLSLAAATLPIIDNVNGEIVFDDLFTLSTPPGQTLTVERLNPGLAVTNGTIRFQLLSEGRVALEDARWPFAGGALSVAPTTLQLGEPETRFSLILRNVDVEQLLTQLNVPDLTATGTVEGEFPLELTATAANIIDGTLRSGPGGGSIAYTGDARQNATGMARIAFDALASFRYDNLVLNLSGDLGGDVLTTIRFTGVNQSPVGSAGIGGLPLIGATDVPFRFNVAVTAPFRSLANTAATLTDATTAIHMAPDLEQQQQQPEPDPAEPPATAPTPVDPPPQ